MKRYCLACDLKDDPLLISQYEEYHRNVWPEIKKSILDSGILNMEIWRVGNRLVMVIETKDDFSFEKKASMDESNEKVREWEQLMAQFQQLLPWAKPGQKWILMDSVFELGRN